MSGTFEAWLVESNASAEHKWNGPRIVDALDPHSTPGHGSVQYRRGPVPAPGSTYVGEPVPPRFAQRSPEKKLSWSTAAGR